MLNFDEFSLNTDVQSKSQIIQADEAKVALPDDSYVRDASFARDGSNISTSAILQPMTCTTLDPSQPIPSEKSVKVE